MLVFLCRFRAPSAILHTLKMATTSFSGLQFAVSRSCVPSSQKIADASAAVLGGKSMIGSWNKLASACNVASVQPFQRRGFTSSSIKSVKSVTKATSESSAENAASGLQINLKGIVQFLWRSLLILLFIYMSWRCLTRV